MRNTEIGKECTIPLNGNATGLFTTIDWVDLKKVAGITWYLHKKGYARGFDKSSKKQVYLHNIILRKKDGLVVDHINENKLDNRRKNLRYLTNLQNITRSGSRAKGVPKGTYRMPNGTWRAAINENGKTKLIGFFSTVDKAAEAYNKEARKLYGKLAFQN